MRLLWFSLAADDDDPVLGFATRWVSAVAARVASIDVVTMRRGRVDLPANVRVHSVGKERGLSEPRRALHFLRVVEEVVRARRPHACFSHMIPVFTVLAAPLLRPRRIPVVSWYAHAHVPMDLRLAHHLSARVLTPAAEAYGYRRDRLTVLGHGVDTALFRPGPAPPRPPLRVVSVGRISPVKDLLTVVDAIALLRQAGRAVTLRLVGGAPEQHAAYAGAVRRRIAERGLEQAATATGPVAHRDAPDAFRAGHVHVNAGAAGGALDKAVLEAMACARPSVTSIRGFAPTMGPHAPALLFREGDPRDLARAIGGLAERAPAELAAMGDDLRLSVAREHGLDRLVGRLVRELVAAAARSGR